MRTGEGALYVTVNRDAGGKPFEIFLHGDKAGGCEVAKMEAIARLASLALQRGVDVHEVQEQLAGIRCSKQFGVGSKAVLSCADAVAKAIAMGMEGDNK